VFEVLKNSSNNQQEDISKEILVSIAYSIFCQAKLLLDQGNATYQNKRQHIWIYFVGSCVILVGVVLNNAYKGDNIVQITSPLPLRAYKTLADAVENGFKIYSSSFPSAARFMYDNTPYGLETDENITFIEFLKVR